MARRPWRRTLRLEPSEHPVNVHRLELGELDAPDLGDDLALHDPPIPGQRQRAELGPLGLQPSRELGRDGPALIDGGQSPGSLSLEDLEFVDTLSLSPRVSGAALAVNGDLARPSAVRPPVDGASPHDSLARLAAHSSTTAIPTTKTTVTRAAVSTKNTTGRVKVLPPSRPSRCHPESPAG
jgi:hypothetical protein